MLKATITTGLAIALTCLNATADTDTDYAIGDWGMVEPSVPVYQYRSSDMPLTGAARFEVRQSGELDAMLEAEYREPSRFGGSFEPISFPDQPGGEQSFGPGPELVAPTPTQVFEFRSR